MNPRTISIFVPAFNEEGNLAGAIDDALILVEDFQDFEILIVDDGSTDGTFRVASEIATKVPQVRVIRHPHNLGLGEGLRSALAAARMNLFTLVPGDREIELEGLKNMFAAAGQLDLVVTYHATPWVRPWYRRLLTNISVSEVNLLFGLRMKYYQGPTIYPTALARILPTTTSGFFLVTEMLVHALVAGYTWTPVGFAVTERTYGQSKAVSLSKMFNAEKTILQLWWDIRIRKQRIAPKATATLILEENVGAVS